MWAWYNYSSCYSSLHSTGRLLSNRWIINIITNMPHRYIHIQYDLHVSMYEPYGGEWEREGGEKGGGEGGGGGERGRCYSYR